MKKFNLDAVIFDMDGVLIDSEPFWEQAQIEVFARVGLTLTAEDTYETIGVRLDEVVAYWFDRRPWRDPTINDVISAILDRVVVLVYERGERMQGVGEVLELLADLGLPMALATSSSPRLIQAVLEKLELVDVFSVLCSAADEERGKPDPAVFLTAARRLAVDPTSCLVVEDSVMGLKAGKAAAMRVIVVPAPYQYDLADFDHADLKLRSLAELDRDLIYRLTAPR